MLRVARWLLFAAVRPFGLLVHCWDGSNYYANGYCPAQPAQDVSGASQGGGGGGGAGADPLAAPTLTQALAKSQAKPQEPMKQLKDALPKIPPGMGWLVLLAVAVAVAGKH